MPDRHLVPGRLRVALTVAVLLGGPGPLAGQSELEIGAPAPAVTLEDLDGSPYSFDSFLGKKPALIEFWATWCTICEKLLPQLRAARERLGDRVEFIGVNVTVNQTRDEVRRYAAEHRPPFRILWDEQGESIRAYDVIGTSFIVIVDGEGKVVYWGDGVDQDVVGELERVVGRGGERAVKGGKGR